MSSLKNVAAVDLGAESGRVIVASFDGAVLRLDEAHRFPNEPVRVRSASRAGDNLHWDVLRLFHEIKTGLSRAARKATLSSAGLDTWGVDFALLDSRDRLIGNPYHYRDARNDGMLDVIFKRVPRESVFERTGIQFLPFNSLPQLMAMVEDRDDALDAAQTFLTIPDLFNFWLSGAKACEFTNATTTQMYDTRASAWARGMLATLDIPSHIFPDVVQPGTVLGHVLPAVSAETGLPAIPLIAPACHDTGSAVAGTPLSSARSAYISSGTWSLIGVEAPAPVITAEALAGNFTNEGGVNGTVRLLKNVMGLWLLQESRRTWAHDGHEYGYAELARLASEAQPFVSLIEPDDASFLAPGDMPARIRAYCAARGQHAPSGVAETARCIFDSLALKYRLILEKLEGMLGHSIDAVHVVGGGSQNALLCQLTADAARKPVHAGPVEATAIGNALVQLIALGAIGSLEEGRAIIAHSFPTMTYTPGPMPGLDEAFARFKLLNERRAA